MNSNTILQWYLTSGITETISETPINRFRDFAESTAETFKKTFTNQISTEKIKEEPNLVIDSFVKQAQQAANEAQNISQLHVILDSFDGCSLKKTSSHTFLGIGKTQQPDVFCIFDAPRAAADKSGNLFDGELGGLMQKMLNAIQLSVETNTYAAPLIPWRLPGDRKPTETEIQICLPFLQKQIELVRPRFLLLFSATVSKALLGIESISKARQQSLLYTGTDISIPTLATFGPEMVSQSKISRANAWADLQKLQKKLQENS